MGRPALAAEILEAIEEKWAMDRHQTAKAVHAAVGRRWGRGVVSLRKVQEVIRIAKGRGGRIEIAEWEPWVNAEESSSDTEYLMGVQLAWMTIHGRRLQRHEALWARRLRWLIERAQPRLRMFLISFYAAKEVVGQTLNRSPPTRDLDDMMMYEPWSSSARWHLYELAVASGEISVPRFFSELEGAASDGGDMHVYGTDALLLEFAATAASGSMKIDSVHPSDVDPKAEIHVMTPKKRRQLAESLFDRTGEGGNSERLNSEAREGQLGADNRPE